MQKSLAKNTEKNGKLPLIIVGLFLVIAGKGQNNDIRFNKIVYADYMADLPKAMHNNRLNIITYAEIDNKGKMDFIEIDRNSNKKKYYNYQLTKVQLENLDSIMDELPFNQQIEDTDYIEGIPYAGQYSYLEISTSSNKKDEICFVYSIMSDKFKEAIDLLGEIFRKEENYKTTYRMPLPSSIQADILRLHKKSKYLPLIGSPPSSQ